MHAQFSLQTKQNAIILGILTESLPICNKQLPKKCTLFFFHLEISKPFSDAWKRFFGRLEAKRTKMALHSCEERLSFVARMQNKYAMIQTQNKVINPVLLSDLRTFYKHFIAQDEFI